MSKLIIMRGLPASGKSTRAKQIIDETGNTVRLTKDLLRTMLHYDKWTGNNEKITNQAERELAAYFLRSMNVIIDDTNLNPKVLNYWRAFHANNEVVDLTNVPMQECVNRDEFRQNRVGRSVIVNMAMQYGLAQYVHNSDVVCDIDGTLANLEHRLQYINQGTKDWDSFFSHMHLDTPILQNVELVKALSYSNNIILVSGRPETYRKITEEWLAHNHIQYFTLLMRKTRDTRADDIVKEEILNTYLRKDNIKLVIDDRPRVIRMWQRNGLVVKDVGNGKEF